MPSTTANDDWTGVLEHAFGVTSEQLSSYRVVWSDGNQWIRFEPKSFPEFELATQIHINSLEGLL